MPRARLTEVLLNSIWVKSSGGAPVVSENCLQGVATGVLPATWMSTSHFGRHKKSKHKKKAMYVFK